MGAGEENLRTALLAPNVVDVGANPVAVAEDFPRQHLVAPHDRFAAAEVDDDVAVFDAFDDAVDDVADAILVFVVLPVALGFAPLLHDPRRGRLRGNAAVFERRQRIGDGIADLGRGVAAARFVEAYLHRRIFHRLDHQHVARQVKLARLRIDFGAHFGLAAVARTGGLGDRVLHGAEHDPAIDGFFPGDRVGDLQQFEFVGAYGRHWSVSLELTHRLVLFQPDIAMFCLLRPMPAVTRPGRFAFAALAPS